MPVALESLEYKYINSGDEFSKKTAKNNYDSYGNVTFSEVEDFEWRNSWVEISSSTTSNEYGQDVVTPDLWVLGLVTKSTHTKNRTGAGSRTMISTFEYDNDKILFKGTTDSEGGHEVSVTYVIDGFGNRESAEVTPAPDPNGGSATTVYDYDDSGRYRQSTVNALNHTVLAISDRDAYGNPLESIDSNGVSTKYGYDAMGRKFFSSSTTGAWVKEVTGGAHGNCPTENPNPTAYTVTRTSASEPASWTCYDAQARVIRTVTTGFNGELIRVNTGYDDLGRVAFVSVPHVSTKPIEFGDDFDNRYTKTTYDVYNRPTSVNYAGGRSDSFSYGQEKGHGGVTYHGAKVTSDDNGETVEVYDVANNRLYVTDKADGVTKYTYDAANNITSVDGPLSEPLDDQITISYNNRGWKTGMSDPDKGEWSYIYHPTGELARQDDGNGNFTEFEYDAVGRIVKRVDSLNTHPADPTVDDVQTTIYNYVGGSSLLGFVYICKEFVVSCGGTNRPFSRSLGYDQGRLVSSETTINRLVSGQPDQERFETQTTYDHVGRVFQEFETFMGDYRPESGLQYNYNPNKYLESLQESRGSSGSSTLFQHVTAMDAWGNVVESVLGNNVTVTAAYDESTGRLIGADATNSSGKVQELHYIWDVIGNLTDKIDTTDIVSHQQIETYTYDVLQRLKTVKLSSEKLGVNNSDTMTLDYDAAGNITKKNDKEFLYGESLLGCEKQTGPHAVSTYDYLSPSGGVTYCYDVNGNNISSSDGRNITYTSFNKSFRIEQGSNASEFSYGPNRSRYRRVETDDNEVTEEVLYVGNTEVIYDGLGDISEYRRNIGGIAIKRLFILSNGATSEYTDYILRDNLGSPHTILNDGGDIIRIGFDAHGSRREGYDPQLLIEGYNPMEWFSERGFTGHEHLDELGVIHMNGRIYDPGLGRFLQADPLIQDLSNPQSLNRYTYVFNNPLAYTDPSGYSALSKYWRPILSLAVSWASGSWSGSLYQAGNTAAALAVSMGGGALAGAIATGSGKGVLPGAFTGAASFGVSTATSGRRTSRISNRNAMEGAHSTTGGFSQWAGGVVVARTVASNDELDPFAQQAIGLVQKQKFWFEFDALTPKQFRAIFPSIAFGKIDDSEIDLAKWSLYQEHYQSRLPSLGLAATRSASELLKEYRIGRVWRIVGARKRISKIIGDSAGLSNSEIQLITDAFAIEAFAIEQGVHAYQLRDLANILIKNNQDLDAAVESLKRME